MIQGIGHIGIVVKDVESSVAAICKALALPVPPIKDIPEKKMKVAMVEVGELGLEFIQDDNAGTPFAKLVKEQGDTIHHFCLLSDDIQADIDTMRDRGVEMADLQPRMGLRGKPIAFTKASALNGIPFELSVP
jgi:methylmalonyl-CoA/ethylmalonyl-CoA epimerase